MAKKANGKIREIRDGQVVLEVPLPIADVLAGIPGAEEAVEGFIKGYGIKKSSISRHFVKVTAEQMREFRERDLSGLELCAIFIDGIESKKHLLVAALGLDREGENTSLGYGRGQRRMPLSVTIFWMI